MKKTKQRARAGKKATPVTESEFYQVTLEDNTVFSLTYHGREVRLTTGDLIQLANYKEEIESLHKKLSERATSVDTRPLTPAEVINQFLKHLASMPQETTSLIMEDVNTMVLNRMCKEAEAARESAAVATKRFEELVEVFRRINTKN